MDNLVDVENMAACSSPSTLIVFIISKCNHNTESGEYVTIRDVARMSDILKDNLHRKCDCMPVSEFGGNIARCHGDGN